MGNRRQEIPVPRRDVASRNRRWRIIGRFLRKRAIFVLLVSLTFLSFLAWKSLLDRGFESKAISNIKFPSITSELDTDKNQRSHLNYSDNMVHSSTAITNSDLHQVNHSKYSNNSRRRRHSSCEIDFMTSIDYFMEPADYMNFTRFSLEYIEEEKNYDGRNAFHGRFAGHQTLAERENSFYAHDQTIHCGFVRELRRSFRTGFVLEEKDKEYMNGCKVVVSSCIFGGFDFLRTPTKSKISEYSKKNVCFVMFLDKLTRSRLYSDGKVPDDSGHIGLWRIVEVKDLPYLDMRKSGKVPKFLSHRLFPASRYSIWIDSKMRLNADPMLILEYFLWRKRSEYAISNHYDRHCVWEEVIQNKRLNKYNHSAIDEQFILYQSDGLTQFNKSDGTAPLPSYVPEGSFIIRAHTPMSNLFSCLWFNEVDRFTSRDQLSFAYTFLKLMRMNPGKPFFLNMFKDCERRALAKLFRHRNEYPPPPPVG